MIIVELNDATLYKRPVVAHFTHSESITSKAANFF